MCKKCKPKCFDVCCRIEEVDRILRIWRIIKHILRERLVCGINHERTQQRLKVRH